MTLDVGPVLESVAPFSILLAAAFAVAKIIYEQKEQGKKIDKIMLMFDSLSQKHATLERKVLDDEMYERGLMDAAQRRRVMDGASKRRRTTRS